MLDDYYRVSDIDQPLKHSQEHLNVFEVQPSSGLIEQEKGRGLLRVGGKVRA